MLGYCSKRKARVSLARKYERTQDSPSGVKTMYSPKAKRVRGIIETGFIDERLGAFFVTLLYLTECELNCFAKYNDSYIYLLHQSTIMLFSAESPFPFNRKGKMIMQASQWSAIKPFSGNPPEIALLGR